MKAQQTVKNNWTIAAAIFCLLALAGSENNALTQAQPYFKGSVQVKDLQFEYEASGSGIPLIMIHGFSVDRETMRGCMEPILKNKMGWKRIYFDLPGMGKTKGQEWVQTSDHMLEVVREFIRQVIPGQKYVLVGESYGGYLCRGIVHQDAANVLGMCVICPLAVPADADRDVPPQTIFKRDAALFSQLDESERAYFDALVAVQSRPVWERFEAEMISGFAKVDGPFVQIVRQTKNYAFSFPVDHLPQPFTGPSLILTGRQDSGVGYKDQYKFIEQYPRASFVILDMCGHALQIEQAELFNAMVNEWLDRVLWSLAQKK